MGYKRHRVVVYVPDPLRCYRCQRYGHKATWCNGKERCSVCSGPHPVKNCPHTVDKDGGKETKCANCQGSHSTSYRGCPRYKEAKEVTRFQFTAQSKMTYAQAILKVREIKANKESRDSKECKEKCGDKRNNESKENTGNEIHAANCSKKLENQSPPGESSGNKSRVSNKSTIQSTAKIVDSCEKVYNKQIERKEILHDSETVKQSSPSNETTENSKVNPSEKILKDRMDTRLLINFAHSMAETIQKEQSEEELIKSIIAVLEILKLEILIKNERPKNRVNVDGNNIRKP